MFFSLSHGGTTSQCKLCLTALSTNTLSNLLYLLTYLLDECCLCGWRWSMRQPNQCRRCWNWT